MIEINKGENVTINKSYRHLFSIEKEYKNTSASVSVVIYFTEELAEDRAQLDEILVGNTTCEIDTVVDEIIGQLTVLDLEDGENALTNEEKEQIEKYIDNFVEENSIEY